MSMDKQRLQDLIGPDYTLHWVIGHGGMSTVWLADDNRASREVAIKVLRPEFSDNDEFLGRFRNEAATAKSLSEPGIVATYDYRELDDPSGTTFCFMALEYVRGESLADRIARDKQLPEEEVLSILEQAAAGLGVIHDRGMVHRDIKPGNLLLAQNGQVKITDFGIAKAAEAVPLTRTGMVVGTAQYVSPEQAQGLEVTPATDVYSLGVVGYEMLAGARPFTGDSTVSVALAHISQAAPPLPTSISAHTRELISVMLRKDPVTRYPDGAAVARAVSDIRLGRTPAPVAPLPDAEALTEVSSGVSAGASSDPAAGATSVASAGAVQAPAATGMQPAQEPARRRPVWPWLLLALGLAAVSAGAVALLGGGKDTPAPDPVIVTEFISPTESAGLPTAVTVTHVPTQESVVTSAVTSEETTEPTSATPSETAAVEPSQGHEHTPADTPASSPTAGHTAEPDPAKTGTLESLVDTPQNIPTGLAEAATPSAQEGTL